MKDHDTNTINAFCSSNRRLPTAKLLLLLLGNAIAHITILGINANSPVIAQTITPAADGTNSIVNQSGNTINITGGTLSGDNANLFHSFQKFGLNANQTAIFLSHPNVQNILGRVVGGDPSVINGLIQVTGGNSNLYLINPAGIIFGSNARLNVTADFTATTATGIGIGNSWFNVFGGNDYNNLVGTPSAFKFDTNQPGSIVNFGDLTVSKNLTLIGATVVSTGNLSAPNGNITVASVPGENLIRISQTGHLLSLEIPAAAAQSNNINVLKVAELLTGPTVENNGSITVNNEQVQLTNSGIVIHAGDVIAKTVQANNAILSAENNLTLPESTLITTGNLTLQAKNTVVARDSLNNSFTAQAGGNLHIQGNQNIDILALNHPQTPFVSGGNLTLASDGIVSGDAHFLAGGEFKISNLSGGFGNFASKYDPIISSLQNVSFGNYTGASLKVEAQGSIQGGNITITSADTSGTIPLSDPDRNTLITSRAVILRAGVTPSNIVNTPQNVGGTSFTDSSLISPATINVGNIDTSTGADQTGLIELKAPGSITTGSLNASSNVNNEAGGNINIENTNSNIFINGNINTQATGTNAVGGNINLKTGVGTINLLNDINASGTAGGGSILFDGNVSLNSANINITTNNNDITFNKLLDNSVLSNLTLAAGTGNINFNASVGSVSSLNELNILSASQINMFSYVATRRPLVFNQPVNLTGNTLLANYYDKVVTFNSTLNANTFNLEIYADEINFAQPVTGGQTLKLIPVNSNLNTNLGSSVDTAGVLDITQSELTNLQNSFSTISFGSNSGSGTLNVYGNINTVNQNLNFNNAVSVATNSNINVGNADITFNRPVNGNADLSLSAGTGTIKFSGSVGALTPLNNLVVTANSILVAEQVKTQGSQTFNGFVTLTSDTIFTANEIDFRGGTNSVTGFGKNITLQPFSDSQAIIINETEGTAALDISTIDVAALGDDFSLVTIGSQTGTGTINISSGNTFDNSLVVRSPLGSIINNGITLTNGSLTLDAISTTLNGNITTNNSAITFSPNNKVTLGGSDVTLNSGDANITFGNTIDGNSNLILNAGTSGIITFNGAVGQTTSLNSLTSNAQTTQVASNINTTGDINFNNPVILTQPDTEITSTNGSVNFNQTVDGSSNLSVNGQNISFNGAVGGTTPLNSLSANSFNNINLAGNINSLGDITFSGLVNINNNILVESSGTVTTNNVNSNTNLSGNTNNITIQALGNIITGNLSTATNTGNAGFVNLNSINGRVETGNINTNNSGTGNGGAVDILAGDRIFSQIINSSSQNSNGGIVTLNSTNNLVATSINSQGGTSGQGGDINILASSLQIVGIFINKDGINASISSTGETGSGSITITHNNESFIVGNPTINGTAGAIVSKFTNKIEPTTSIFGTYQQGNITINSPFVQPTTTSNNTSSISTSTSNIDTQKFIYLNQINNQQNLIPPPPVNHHVSLVAGEQAINRIEEIHTQDYTSSLALSTKTIKTTKDIQADLKKIQQLTGIKSALIYLNFANANSINSSGSIKVVQDSDVLYMGVVTAEGLLTYQAVEGATRKQVMAIANKFRFAVTDLNHPHPDNYLISSQKLYQLLIASREAELQKQGINNLMFVMDEGLRAIPLAALHDGKQFLIEKYSLALIPSFSLTNTEYKGLQEPEVLAMGAENFTPEQKQTQLRAVPIELSTITKEIKGKYFINQEFTLNNLKKQQAIKFYPIIHLATHAYFPGAENANEEEPYIQLYNDKLSLSKIEQLGWNNPPVELLVLSACRSAIGDDKAELGFAGLAVKSGVKSAVASLWYVSDSGTFGLMTEFYNQLQSTPIKAEALRQAQIAMLRKQVRLEGNEFVFSQGKISIPQELVTHFKNDLSHPYYWAAFNVIGSPW